MFTNWFAKQKLRWQLRKFVKSEAVDAVLDGRSLDKQKLQSGRIEFVLVLVRAENAEQLSKRTGFVTEVGIEHNAFVDGIVGPLVVMAFGTLQVAQHSATSRADLVSHLQRQFGNDIKIVHGATEGHYGLFGSNKRMSYTFTFPRFDVALAALGRLEYGQTEELRA